MEVAPKTEKEESEVIEVLDDGIEAEDVRGVCCLAPLMPLRMW